MPSSSSPTEPTNELLDRVIVFLKSLPGPVWAVGGHVRDRLLGRHSHDLDLVVPDGGVRLVRAAAAAFGGASFVLDDARDVGRALLSDEATGQMLVVDVARLRVPDLLDDLALRDFTVNAIAWDLSTTEDGPRYIDPLDGRADLARGLLRAVADGAFRDDPLRMLRAVRMVAELGFRVEDSTGDLIRRDAGLLPLVAAERVRDELIRILAAPGAWQHVRLLHELGLLAQTLPESAVQVGVTQSAPHYQDIFDHSRSVLWHLEGIFALLWPELGYAVPMATPGDATIPAAAPWWDDLAALLAPYAEELRAHLSAPLASDHPRRALLMWAALAHDWGKPAKRVVADDGLTHFYGHDQWGALLAQARLTALRFAGDEVAYVARLVGMHMRPGLMVSDGAPSRRAIYRFFRDADTTGPDCALLSLADIMATRAHAPDAERWRARLETADALLEAYFRQRAQRVDPPPLLDGRQVMDALGLRPGPQVGALLDALREAQAVGEVSTPDEARAWLMGRAAEDPPHADR